MDIPRDAVIKMQDEIDLRAYSAIEQLVNLASTGEMSSTAARQALTLVQISLSGLVSFDKEFFQFISETDAFLQSLPVPMASVDYIYKRKDVTPVLLRLRGERLVVKQGSKTTFDQTYDTPSEAFERLMSFHQKLVKLRYKNQ